MGKIILAFDRITDFFARMAGVLLAFMTLSVCAEVVMRYFLRHPLVWVVEINQISMVYLTFLGIAWLQKNAGHVNIDLLLNRLSPRARILLDTVNSVLGIVACCALVWYGVKVTLNQLSIGAYQATALNIPNAAVLVIIPVGSFLYLVQYLRTTGRCVRKLTASQYQTQPVTKTAVH